MPVQLGVGNPAWKISDTSNCVVELEGSFEPVLRPVWAIPPRKKHTEYKASLYRAVTSPEGTISHRCLFVRLVSLKIDGTGLDGVYSIYQDHIFFQKATYVISVQSPELMNFFEVIASLQICAGQPKSCKSDTYGLRAAVVSQVKRLKLNERECSVIQTVLSPLLLGFSRHLGKNEARVVEWPEHSDSPPRAGPQDGSKAEAPLYGWRFQKFAAFPAVPLKTLEKHRETSISVVGSHQQIHLHQI